MTTSSNSDGRDELDDPTLRSMRAVWVSMRDEEPPAAGLASLLAAARTKAEAMRDEASRPGESWLRRMLAVLQRPPTLALATVAVLLGGAIVIGARREALDSVPMVETERGGGAGRQAALEQSAALEQPAALAKDPAAGSAAAPEAVAPMTATPALERKDTRARVETKVRRPAPAPVLPPAATPALPPPATPAPPPPAPKGAGAVMDQELEIAGDGGGADVAAPEAAAAVAPGPRDSSVSVSVSELAKQSAAAAARGDCAAVRAIVDRIRRLDGAFHRSHVEGNAAVKRCVK